MCFSCTLIFAICGFTALSAEALFGQAFVFLPFFLPSSRMCLECVRVRGNQLGLAKCVRAQHQGHAEI